MTCSVCKFSQVSLAYPMIRCTYSGALTNPGQTCVKWVRK